MNFGLSEMRLVEPKGDWPNQKAINTASGAERVLEEAKIYSTTQDAVSDLQRLYATTARARDMEKPVLAPRELARNTSFQLRKRGEVGYFIRAGG